MRILLTAVAAAVSIGLAATPSFAQSSYGSAASTAYNLGATASPGVRAASFPPSQEPAVGAVERDVLTTGSIVRLPPQVRTRAHRR